MDIYQYHISNIWIYIPDIYPEDIYPTHCCFLGFSTYIPQHHVIASCESYLKKCCALQAAMENAYNICHNVQDLLLFRGFFWEGQKQKGGKKGRKKKGKGK